MNQPELKKLFLIINNAYNAFTYDETKTAIWLDLLQDTPFDLAQRNLRKHIKSSPYPPTLYEIMKPEKDPAQYVDYTQLKAETDERLKLVAQWQREAVPRGLPHGHRDSAQSGS